MEQLNGLDASFLAVESANQTGHVASLMLFEADASPAEPVIDAVRRKLAARVPGLAPLRRRLVEVPFGLDRPFWIDDPDFDLDYHLRHIAVPPPGSDEQLAELVARIHARPLDRARPLWEAYVIEGHESGQVALYMKVHHCAVDGVAGVELARVLFSDEPGEVASAKRMTRSEPVPSSLEMLLRGALGLARRPRRIVRGALRAAQAAGALARRRRPRDGIGASPARALGGARPRAGSVSAARAQLGRGRGYGAPRVPGTEDAVQPLDHAAPPLRLGGSVARRGQARAQGLRRHAQRRRAGDLVARAAQLARAARGAAARPVDRDGAGLGARGRRNAARAATASRVCWPTSPATSPIRCSVCCASTAP